MTEELKQQRHGSMTVKHYVSAESLVSPEKQAVPRPKQKIMSICFRLERPLTIEDKPLLVFAECLMSLSYKKFKKEYPLLNGLNGRPRLDMSMYQFFVYNNPTLKEIQPFYEYMEELCDEFCEKPFVLRDNMKVQWFAE